MNLFFLAVFGAVGVICRYYIDNLVASWSVTTWPVSTFLINCVGSLGIGAIYGATKDLGIVPTSISLFLTVGLLGGFTTFSAYSIQTLQLLEQGRIWTGAAYLIGSPIAGLACAFVGVFAARTIVGAL